MKNLKLSLFVALVGFVVSFSSCTSEHQEAEVKRIEAALLRSGRMYVRVAVPVIGQGTKTVEVPVIVPVGTNVGDVVAVSPTVSGKVVRIVTGNRG